MNLKWGPKPLRFKLLLTVSLSLFGSRFAAANATLDSFIEQKDYLGVRVYLRKMLYRQKITPQKWLETRSFVTKHITDVGYDILYAWDRNTPNAAETKRIKAMNSIIARADDFMLKKNYSEAFKSYQRIALVLKADMKQSDQSVVRSARILYPYILEGMGRSLYSMRRFQESAEVFSWIQIGYPRFRRALFEQMWASFQTGRVDLTLGQIAAQFSAFFTDFHMPEAYLVQAYVHKKLCRKDELRAVIEKMKRLRNSVKNGSYTWREWTKTDIEGLVLEKILTSSPREPSELVTAQERAAEKQRIERALSGAFAKEKPMWLDNMETAIAYAQLSTGKNSLLKTVEKLPNRSQLFKQDLEIWPADSREEWIDEMGSHRFVGESQCGQNP